MIVGPVAWIAGRGPEATARTALWMAILPLLLAVPVAAVAGLVSFFSPCVVPLLPGYVSYATGLSGADLEVATLSGTNLEGTNLSGANLTEADLSGAQIIDADLSDADLTSANLTGATITGTNLDGATLCGTDLDERDDRHLRAEALESVRKRLRLGTRDDDPSSG